MKNLILLLLFAVAVAFAIIDSGNKTMPRDKLEVTNQSLDPFSEVNGTVGGRCQSKSKKCLTVYVAPWCSACTAARPTIIEMTKQLESEGVDVRIVAGSDQVKVLKKYAKKYPFPVLLDPDGRFYSKTKEKAVPFFLVSDRNGEIISGGAGAYDSVSAMRNWLKL